MDNKLPIVYTPLNRHDITEILLKVALNTLTPLYTYILVAKARVKRMGANRNPWLAKIIYQPT